MINFDVVREAGILKATAQRAMTINTEVAAVVRYYGQILNTRIKAKASGRPGPNAPTGDYRRSWTHTVSRDGGATVSTNGTNRPQGRRLEFGFTGVDSLGRSYNQPPYPHAEPAFHEVEPRFVDAMKKIQRSI